MITTSKNDVVELAKEDCKQHIAVEEAAAEINAGKKKDAVSIDRKISISLSYSTFSKDWCVHALIFDRESNPGTSNVSFNSYEDALEYFNWMKCKYDLKLADNPASDADK